MNFFNVFKSDVKGLFGNKFLRIAAIVILAIPLIYGGTYLAAFWDPYSKTSTLPVALVNLDEGGVFNDAKVNFGRDITDNLKNNDDLGWIFVNTQNEAEEGLKGDKYYAMLIIPKDFSKKLIDVNNGIVQKPKLTFVANKKKNYIVGIIADKASTAIKEQVTKSVSSKFSNVVFDNLLDVRDGLLAASDGTSQLKDGVADLKNQIPALTSGLGKLDDGSNTLASRMKDAYDGSEKLKNGIETMKGKMPELVDGVNKLYNGSTSLSKNMSDTYNGSKKLRDGALQINDMLPDVTNGANDLYEGSTNLKEGIEEVHDNMPDMVSGVSSLRSGSAQISSGLQSAVSSTSMLYSGVDNMESSVMSSICTSLNTPGSDGIKPIDKVLGGLQQILNGPDGKSGMNALNAAIAAKTLPLSEASAANWNKDYKILQDFNDNFAVVKSSANPQNINTALQNIGAVINGTNPAAPVSQLTAASKDISDMANEIKSNPYYSLSADLQNAYGGLEQISGGITSLDGSLSSLRQPISLLQGLYTLSIGIGRDSNSKDSLAAGLQQLRDGSESLYGGLDELYNKTNTLKDGVDSLYSGSQNLTNGIDKFRNTVPNLTNGLNQITDGSRDLTDGLFKLNSSAGNLNNKMGELNNKIPDLAQGTNDLYGGSKDLSEGISKLQDGTITLNNGIKTIDGKMPELQNGVNKIYEGTTRLNDELSDGSGKLSDKLVAGSKTMGNFAAEPVKLDDTPLYDVNKYGLGLSPYFMSLGLWVGALLVFFLLTDEVQKGMEANNTDIVMGKYLTVGAIGTIQAIVLSIAALRLGLKPSNMFIYFAFNIFLSWVFIAIMQCLIFILGDIGRLASIILLILQLTSSNGTFPRELLPKFFKIVNPVMPFTYSISAMREINSGIDYSVLGKDVLVLSIILIIFLTLTIKLKKYSDSFKDSISLEKQRAEMLNEA